MKCVCISCFDSFDIRMKHVIEMFKKNDVDVKYVVADFNHYSKKYVKDNSHTKITVHVPAYKKNVSLQRVVSHIVFSRNVKKILIQEKPEFVYCIIPPNSVIKAIAKYKKIYPQTRVAFDFFDCWPESFPSKMSNKVVKLFFKQWKSMRDEYIHCANLLIYVAEGMRETINAGGINNIVIPPAMNEDFIDLFETDIENEVRFCYLGNINYITDIDTIVKLLTGISKQKKVLLEIIGEGANLARLKDKLNDNNIEVVCHGVIMDGMEKKKIFSRCAFGLNIPKKEVNVTMSLKSVEYMRTGLPYINTAGGMNYDIVREYGCGINVNRNNMYEFVDKIVALNNDNIREMQDACIKAYNEKFSPKLIESSINSFINSYKER